MSVDDLAQRVEQRDLELLCSRAFDNPARVRRRERRLTKARGELARHRAQEAVMASTTPAPRATCPECNGKARIVISTGPAWSPTSTRTRICDRCQGIGTVAASTLEEAPDA